MTSALKPERRLSSPICTKASPTRSGLPGPDVGQSLDRIHGAERAWGFRGPRRHAPTGRRRPRINRRQETRMPTIEDVKTWRGEHAHTGDGEKLGTIADIYLDRDTGEPEWAAIKTGLFGSKVSFAPLAEATHSGDGVQLPYTKDEIKDAPSAEADGELSEDEEAALYRHYGLSYSDEPSDSGLPTSHQPTDRGPVGHDTSGPTTDDAMTRSEEEV